MNLDNSPEKEFILLQAEGKMPQLLDLVMIDGRWAQVGGGGSFVTYLDTGRSEKVDWSNFELDGPKIDLALINAVKVGRIQFPKELLEKIHWGGEEEKNPELKQNVKVFGIFKKKGKL